MNPRRGEIWRVDFEPTRGAEIKKTRPCIVVSLNTSGRLPLRLVVPLTGWQESFVGRSWLTKIPATPGTGLTKDSAADIFQMRSVDLSRFDASGPMGRLPDTVLAEVAAAIAVTVGYNPPTPSP